MFGMALAGVILQRFSADPTVVAGLLIAYLDDAPKTGDGHTKQETSAKGIRRRRGILYVDDAGVVSTSSGKLSPMTAVIVGVRQ